MISSYEIALQPNLPARVNAAGAFFRLIGGVDVDITFYRGGGRIGSANSMDSGFYARTRQGEVFDSVEIVSATAQSVSVLVGEAEAGAASEVSVSGDVSVVNGELSRVENGEAFVGAAARSAVAAQYQAIQLMNPVASGRNVVVTKVSAMFGTGGVFAGLRAYNTPLATLEGNGKAKNLAMPGGVAEIRSDSTGGSLGLSLLNVGMAVAFDTKEVPFAEPILIPPGYGLLLGGSLVNINIWAAFQWLEVAP